MFKRRAKEPGQPKPPKEKKPKAPKAPKAPKKPKAPKPPKEPKAPKAPREPGAKRRFRLPIPRRGGGGAQGFRFPKTPLYVMMVGDDGAILLYISDRQVQSRDFAADCHEANLIAFNERFQQDIDAPIVMVVDTMDQTYLQQTLPPVTSLSVGKLLKRRLEREFPNDEMRGALPLGRVATGRKDWNYLMIALERTERLNQWLEYIDTLPNWLSGIYLVPVETEYFLKLLDRALHPDESRKPADWQFFVSYNKVSGFRQAILRKGRIALTRIGQPVGELTPEVIAGNIEQEIQNTIEYMKRMGYQQQEELHLYIIAAEEINNMIEPERLRVTQTYRLTPHMAGEVLGLGSATQRGDQYGDVVLAAVIGAARKHVLKFITRSAQKLDRMFKFKVGQRIATGIITGTLVAYVGATMYDIKSIISDIDNLHVLRNQRQRELDTLKSEIAKAPEDIDKITDMVELYEQMSERAVLPLPLMERLSKTLDDTIRVHSLSWELAPDTVKQGSSRKSKRDGASAEKKPDANDTQVTLKMRVEFLAGTEEQQKFVRTAEMWRKKMELMLDASDVHYVSLPGVIKENENFEISFGNANTGAGQRFDGTPIEADVEITTHLNLPSEEEVRERAAKEAASAAAAAEKKP